VTVLTEARRALLGLVGVLALVAVGAAGPAAAASDLLPDLGMAPLTDLRYQGTSDGRRLLRFTTRIVNVGAGRFELAGRRESTAQALMSVEQHVYADDGTFGVVPIPGATMFYAGDGHQHWHVTDLERYDLEKLDNGNKAGVGAKEGFCFFDNVKYRLTLPLAPQSPVYTGCGTASALGVTMGLSVGWGDEYNWALPGQWIDITTAQPGRYRLTAIADPNGHFVERTTTNNATWVDVQIKPNGARPQILGSGPSA
jgi:hypothetical protein